MVPNEIMLVVYVLLFIGMFLGIFLSMAFLAFFAKEGTSSIRSFAIISLGVIIGTYSLPSLYIFGFHPAYFVDLMLEYPHTGIIISILSLLLIGYIRDRNASNTREAELQS